MPPSSPPSKRTAGGGDSPDAEPVSRQGSLLPVTTAGGAAVGPTGLNPGVPSSVEPSGIPTRPTGEEPVLRGMPGVVFAPSDADPIGEEPVLRSPPSVILAPIDWPWAEPQTRTNITRRAISEQPDFISSPLE